MEGKKTEQNKSKLIIIAVLIVALIASVCFLLKTHGNSKGNDQTSAVTEEDVLKGDPLETPAGELIIPESWSDYVEIEDNSADGDYKKSFYITEGGKKVLLYELIMGENGDGYELGSVPDKNGEQTKVWLNISVIEKDESWSDEEYNEVNTIQSGVNELIDQFYQMDGFQKPEE